MDEALIPPLLPLVFLIFSGKERKGLLGRGEKSRLYFLTILNKVWCTLLMEKLEESPQSLQVLRKLTSSLQGLRRKALL